MVQMYFHCSNTEGTLIDRYGTAVANLTEARDRAAQIMRSMILTPGAEDWRDWVIHVSAATTARRFSTSPSPPCSASRIEVMPC
ncbi:hypothetical protein ACVJGC_002332 [Bradyrhizobium diazoefficiens]